MTKLTAWKMAGAVLTLCAATAIGAHAQTFATLATFNGIDGAFPWTMSLVQGRDGAFYGTTMFGDGINTCQKGCGTAFRITSTGVLTTLPLNPADGIWPASGLVLGRDGNFYGTATLGSANGGTLFEITDPGEQNLLYSFCTEPTCLDGREPQAPLLLAADGNFYGTTTYGGEQSEGTVFKFTSEGSLVTLHSFDDSDGTDFYTGLVQGADGSLYGTTLGGAYGGGTVFKITLTGTLTTLYNFCAQPGCTDGASPYGGLMLGADGFLYGTTSGGGARGAGNVFKITPAGTLTPLYSFCSQPHCSDGALPHAGLVQGTDGNFYGTTQNGGANGRAKGKGTIFRITPQGTLTTLYSFCSQTNCADGREPEGGLVQGTDGNFYGATNLGGNIDCFRSGCGTVFRLSTGLSPFVAFVQPSGKVGATAEILGQGFAGTTNVSLNGIPASFTVVSDTYLTATVPTGATTGYVTVTTPGGTLTSNVPFHVIP